MAVFRHGQNAAVFCDEKNLSPFLNSATISASMDPADVTNFDSGCDMEFIKGLRNATLSCEGMFAAATLGSTNDWVEYFDDAFTGSSRQIVTVCPEGASTGRRAYVFTTDAVSWDISSPVSDVVSASVDFQPSGASAIFGPGRLLAFLTSTSTGSGGAVAFTGSTATGVSTGGGVAHLHVVSENNVTTATWKVQHSTSGSTWADLITFTAATGITFERSTVASDVKEQLRGTLSALTEGATGGSVTWAMAFSRAGSPKS